MASSSKYEVFVSFRGEDTRNNFTSHLYAALHRKHIKTFIDNELDRGEEITAVLLKVIEQSIISVIIFSEKYAESPWCLDELTKILECKNISKQMVLPVFYSVDPQDVAEQKGGFGLAFAKLEERFKKSMDNKIQIWRAALTEAATLSGWDSLVIRPESRLIDEIVEDISKKLNRISSCSFKGLVGVYSRIEKIESLLSIGSDDIRILGIWGMGGIGKTTLAGVVFDHISAQFDGCYFLANVREESEKYGLYRLRKEMLSKILGEENLNTDAYDFRASFVQTRLCRIKALIVLDDVDNFKQIDYLAGEHEWFGPGSRIIVTTRDQDVLKSGVDEVYEVEGLNYHEALELFGLRAFKRNQLREDHRNMSERVVCYASGNPLALKVLGSFLYRRSMREWENALSKLERIPNKEIQSMLRLSYDGLDVEEKDIFLDIACFFKGEDTDFVKRILDGCGFSVDVGFNVLIEKSLVTISNNKLEMHNLLQRMGWEIVREESVKEPGRRSRLWTSGDVFHVLSKNTGTETIEGIFLDMSELEYLHLKPEVFSRMNRLRFLKFHRDGLIVHLPQGLESLSDKLSYLYWTGSPLKYFPSNFCAENLVELSMPFSQVELLWEGCQNLEKLNSIDLKNSRHLIRLPDLSKALNLEYLNLQGCISLLEVPSAVEHFKKLTLLNLENCREVKSIPSCFNMQSLQRLNLSGCTQLKKLPEISRSVKELSLDRTAVEELPVSIESLSKLNFWSMSNCKHLKSLPRNLSMLNSLKSLLISGCLELETLPLSMEKLSQLQKLDIRGCKALTCLPELPPSLNLLNASSCISLETIPSSLAVFAEKMLPKCPNNQRFCFINCPRLDQNARRIIEFDLQFRIQSIASAAVKDYHKGLHSLPSISICFSGNEIPKWFHYQKTNSSISIKLPSNWLNPKFLGFAMCGVVECTDFTELSDIYILCYCDLTTDRGDHQTVNCILRGLPSYSGEMQQNFGRSNYVFMGYDFSLCLRSIQEKDTEASNNYSEATITFCSKKEAGHSYTLRKVNKCGVHLMYSQDEETEIKSSIIQCN
ncbi:disease resistance protein RPV1-like [Mercurialis annua]|uniref:disease resistance protein RPV1-like n=1 Tax=Mercurialis annua TaxID=3986 RepID=UPI00215F102F|nr:disease resistance protein RPV1-like [Mercurialis annua]